MIKALLFFIVIYIIFGGLIFGYKQITKGDVKIVGKLTLAGLLAFIITAVIYMGENL